MSGGLTPAGYVAAGQARSGYDLGVGDYLSNWFQGIAGEEMSMFDFAGEGAEFTPEATSQDYLNYLWQQDPDFYNSIYSDDQKRDILNSENTAQLNFKIKYYGKQIEALDRL